MGKKFIDPKKAVTFRVVHRSLRDPRRADPNFGNFVLEPILKCNSDGKDCRELTEEQRELIEDLTEPVLEDVRLDPSKGIYGSEECDDLYDEISIESEYESKKQPITLEKLEKEFGKLEVEEDPTMNGIFFDNQNEYDYMQHLKVADNSGIVFSVEKKHKDGADLDISTSKDVDDAAESFSDSDSEKSADVVEIERALEDSDYIENDLSDGFFQALNSEIVPDKYVADSADVIHKRIGSSLKSDVAPGLRVSSEDRNCTERDFERLLREEYCDDSDNDRVAASGKGVQISDVGMYLGTYNGCDTNSPLPKFYKSRQYSLAKLDEQDKMRILSCTTRDTESSSSLEFVELEHNPRHPPVDVVSIHDSSTNIYNRPSTISEPVRVRPLKNTNKSGPILQKLLSVDTPNTHINKGKPRDKNETLEEKRNRKAAQKNDRKQRRAEKKEFKVIYKTETLKRVAGCSSLTDRRAVKI